MNIIQNPALRTVFALFLLILALGGCSKDQVANPVNEPMMMIAEDPLDEVLKFTDGYAPAEPDARLARLAELLGLDEEQLISLTEAYMTFLDGMADLHAQFMAGELSREEAREAAAVLRSAYEAELQRILTEEQWHLLQEMRLGAQAPQVPNHGNQPPQ